MEALALALVLLPGGRLELAGAPPPFASPGPWPVGVRRITLTDHSREDAYLAGHRVLVTEVWYPAVDEVKGQEPVEFLDFFAPHPEAGEAFVRHFKGEPADANARFRSVAVRDARPRTGRFPLLVFSHGNGGVRHQNLSQLEHLASHGYVVASPDHPGNAGVTIIGEKVVQYDRKGRPRAMAERPRDVRFVIDSLLAESTRDGSWLHGSLDAEAIGVLGHSFGGLTSCQAADTDRRVKAILPMTLAVTRATAVPMLIMLGDLDRTVGQPGNVASIACFLGGSGPRHLLQLKRGGHFTFTDMDRINPRFGDGIGTEKRGEKQVEYIPSTLAREIIHAYSLAFFDCYLRGDQRAREFLHSNAFPSEVDLRSEEDPVREF